MGCCVSTKKPPASPEFHRHSSKSSRAPPPVVDEETVKEVLSETPNHHFSNKIEQHEQTAKLAPTKNLHKIHHHQQNHNNNLILRDMNVSEICSESNNSTTTYEAEVVEVVVPRRNRSPAKLRSQVSGELRAVRNSPARGKQQSPGRVRSGPEINNNRGSGYYSAGRQRPAPASGQAARSRSPANRAAARGGGGGGVRNGNGVGRSPSARRKESSPSRAGSGLPERVVKPDLSPGVEREERRWDPDPTDGNDGESLDNPLVSLECFIFL